MARSKSLIVAFGDNVSNRRDGGVEVDGGYSSGNSIHGRSKEVVVLHGGSGINRGSGGSGGGGGGEVTHTHTLFLLIYIQ